MKIRLINYGLQEGQEPFRAHDNDAGADVYSPYDCELPPGETVKLPLGFGVEIPHGYAGFVFPRGSMAVQGLTCELPPIDAGYTGEIHAIITNSSHEVRCIPQGARIGQLVIFPVVIADFVAATGKERGAGCFGSTGT